MTIIEDDVALVDRALEYAAVGCYVFPVKPLEKVPLSRHGLNDATRDEEQIKKWWAKWPDANIGVNCGKSHIAVIDFDAYKDPSFRDLNSILDGTHPWFGERPWPETYATLTPAGGVHVWFRDEDRRIPIGASRLHKCIDQRGDGGYVVVPPSRVVQRDGTITSYVLERDATIADAPEWLIDACQPQEHHEKKLRTLPPLPVSDPNVTSYGGAALDDECRRLASTGTGRNHQINVSAFRLGQLIGSGALDRTTVEYRLTQAARSASTLGDHPLTEAEIKASIRSGIDAGLRDPRNIPDTARSAPQSKPKTAPPQGLRINRQRVGDISEAAPRFMWGNRLALGSLNILAGNGGIGKSYSMLSVAKCLAVGHGLPDQGIFDRGSTALVCYEDTPGVIADRMRRLEFEGNGAHGEVHVYHAMDMFTDEAGNPVPFAPEHVDLLIDDLRKISNLRLVVVDPVGSFMGKEVDNNTDNKVRAVLHRLTGLAEELNVAAVIVAHTRKGHVDANSMMDSIMGSSAFKNICRSGLIVLRDPDDEQKSYLFHGKANWTAEAEPIAYTFADGGFHWDGMVSKDMKHLISARSTENPTQRCARWLERRMLEYGTSMPIRMIRVEAKDRAFDRWDVDAARRLLRLQDDGGACWSLPND